MSDTGLGPKLIFQDESFRIEGFFEGRPLTIWEMRNPVMVKLYAKAIYDMHTKSGAAEAIQAYKPMDANKLGIDQAIEEWGPANIARIAKIRAKLTPGTEGNDYILNALTRLEQTYLKDGYQQVLQNLVPRDTIVLSHNDAQENNILSSLDDATKILLIDFEYGMWNPQYFDVANYLMEMCLDNAYPKGTGIKYYLENWPSNDEIENIVKEYFILSKNGTVEWSLENPECQAALQQTKQCCILDNYLWAVWAIMMLSEADETDPTAFNWDFLIGRCDLHLKCVE